MRVEFTGKKLTCSLKLLVKKAVKLTLKELEQPKNICVCVNIVSPDEIRQINSTMRDIDKVTDVLSFPSSSMSAFDKIDTTSASSFSNFYKGNVIIGDMAICMEEVARQSAEYNESIKRCLARLVIHSVLHLLGFDHIKDEDFAIMEPVQNKILNKVVKK